MGSLFSHTGKGEYQEERVKKNEVGDENNDGEENNEVRASETENRDTIIEVTVSKPLDPKIEDIVSSSQPQGKEEDREEKATGEKNNEKPAFGVENHDTINHASGEANPFKPMKIEDTATSSCPQEKKWFDAGYVDPVSRSTDVANLAILDAKNYDGLKHLDVDFAKLYLEHELPEGYHIIKRIGKGAFGCCFLIEKNLERVAPKRGNLSRVKSDTHVGIKDNRCLQLVLKVTLGSLTPRHPVIFYKSCTDYTLMISHKAFPLQLDNLKFILGILKYHHSRHGEVHGDLHPGNMMYFPKDVTLSFYQPYHWRPTPSMIDLWERNAHASHIVQARYDFMDHWFPMEDEQITSIIDPDIGGKIGEAKIVVNHLHHDPRNRNWQRSDDLIGLMNCVIRMCGYSLRSHPQRAIVYGINLESLKMLYEHITDTYENLDANFVFSSIFATAEPFNLELEKGECYLNELLEGKFSEFHRFKGSYSLGSSVDAPTSCVKIVPPIVVQAVPMSNNAVYESFCQLTSDTVFLSTLKVVLELLVDSSIQGGVIFVIVDKVHKDKLQIQALDVDALTRLCRHHAINVHSPSFKHILGSFCKHSETDRWEAPLIQVLANTLELSHEEQSLLSQLENQPKDGAFVISHKGTILAAASRLEHLAPHLELRKVDGTSVGTRHAAALGVAEWMRSEKIYGAVFVKSDAGSVHVMIPGHDKEVPGVAALVDG